MRRPGFTLLELVLAMALGTVIVGVAWALMYSADRADRAIEENGIASAQLERARLATTRMAASVLMAPGSDPRKLAQPESTDDKPSPRRRNRVGINPDDPLPTPRIMLTTDLAAGGVMTPQRTGMDPALLGERMVSSGAFGMGVVPQRLEIVLVDPPVPMTIDKFEAARRVLRRNAERNQRISDAVEGSEDAEALADAAEQEDAEPDVAVRAFRGVFQFRPEGYTDEEIARLERGEAIRPRWKLEWQPLMPRGLYAQDSEPPEAVLDGPARVIATDLAYANWIFFHKGQRTTEFNGTWGGDLPAYLELELETVSGVQVNWMFEVGWAFGPEVPPVAPSTSRIGTGQGVAVPQGTPDGIVGGDTGGTKPSGGPSGGGGGGKTGTVKGGGK
jgi:prepilin-type N-terminal cleavage/methylation domain-containing protein